MKENKEKNVFEKMITVNGGNSEETADKKEKQKEALLQKEKQEEKDKEEYAKQLQREKIELMKIKQGAADGVMFSETAVQPEYTFRQKVSAFFYCNKGAVILAAFFIFLAVFLAVDLIRKPRPDFTMMMTVSDPGLEFCCDSFEKIIEEYIEDTNHNGKILASVYYMPLAEDLDPYTQQASSTKLFALMQDGETVMVMGNRDSDQYIIPDETLVNLEELYPENDHVRGYGFYLSGTSFAKEIGYEGELPEDVYIGLRKVRTGARYRDEMQKNYDISKELLDALVERYSD